MRGIQLAVKGGEERRQATGCSEKWNQNEAVVSYLRKMGLTWIFLRDFLDDYEFSFLLGEQAAQTYETESLSI